MTRIADAGLMCLLGAGLLFVYTSPLIALVQKWAASPMYSYAFAVPFISLAILWLRRDRFRGRPRPAWAPAAAVLGLAFALLAAGQLAAILVVQQFSFLLAIVGYRDITAVVTYFTTGFYRTPDDEDWREGDPDPAARWIFLRANAPRLRSSLGLAPTNFCVTRRRPLSDA